MSGGYAGLWRGIASQGQGDTDLWRGMVSERGVVSCYVPSAARSFAFGELAHIEALVFCVRAYGRVKEICFRGTGAHQGACSFVARDGLGTWGVRAMYRAPRVHLLSGSWRTSRRLCFVSERTVGSKRFAFGELAHIKALAFCVQAARVSNIRAVPRDCLAVSGGMQVCDKRLHDQVQRL